MSKKAKLIIAGVGNVIDIISTLILINYFGFEEMNPLMRVFLQYPVIASITKIVGVTSILLYLNFTKRERYTNGLATFAAILYGGLAVYYILFFISFVIYNL